MVPLPVAIAGIIGALTTACFIAWAGSTASVQWSGWPVFALCGVLAFAIQWVMFIQSWLARSEHLYDLTGSITYVLMIAFALWAGTPDTRAWLLGLLIFVWAARLGPFLFMRIREAGEDRRFRTIKTSFHTLLMTWTLQGLWVFLTAACALAAITGAARAPLGVFAAVGTALWVIGFAIEVIADRQKSAFRANPENADAFITTGLWAWSRHPNYFGEIVLWVGIAVISYPVLVGWQLATLISPIWVVLLLTMISGVRMLENRGRKRWGNDPEYQHYLETVPVLIPRKPRA